MDENETIRELLGIMDEHNLDRIKVKVGDAVYELVRREPGAFAPQMTFAPVPATSPAAVPGAAAPAAHVKRVSAPLTGVFYRAASPDVEPFVTIGARVEVGDVVCVLEAMKLFNEIQSDYAGTVTRIVPENGELVSQGEDLLWIEP
jgi:acetyl-CoA carboxylase biotin carboxyl carrier protein